MRFGYRLSIHSLHRADLVSADASGSTVRFCRSDVSLFCLSYIETNAALMIASPVSGTSLVPTACDEPDSDESMAAGSAARSGDTGASEARGGAPGVDGVLAGTDGRPSGAAVGAAGGGPAIGNPWSGGPGL